MNGRLTVIKSKVNWKQIRLPKWMQDYMNARPTTCIRSTEGPSKLTSAYLSTKCRAYLSCDARLKSGKKCRKLNKKSNTFSNYVRCPCSRLTWRKTHLLSRNPRNYSMLCLVVPALGRPQSGSVQSITSKQTDCPSRLPSQRRNSTGSP